eukprot:TRINITY_DN3709_c0_g2_i1.p1 TRINITY_DN3709_c0_g2~~TRINITY_DN3709_c0_g2_i1.p1  ORF type:complete len:333 (-),score=104.35 TRINITY_DN3709_c0_g2_i1:19-954(-)
MEEYPSKKRNFEHFNGVDNNYDEDNNNNAATFEEIDELFGASNSPRASEPDNQYMTFSPQMEMVPFLAFDSPSNSPKESPTILQNPIQGERGIADLDSGNILNVGLQENSNDCASNSSVNPDMNSVGNEHLQMDDQMDDGKVEIQPPLECALSKFRHLREECRIQVEQVRNALDLSKITSKSVSKTVNNNKGLLESISELLNFIKEHSENAELEEEIMKETSSKKKGEKITGQYPIGISNFISLGEMKKNKNLPFDFKCPGMKNSSYHEDYNISSICMGETTDLKITVKDHYFIKYSLGKRIQSSTSFWIL